MDEMSELFKNLPRASPAFLRVLWTYSKKGTGENVAEINLQTQGTKVVSNTSVSKKSTTWNMYIK